MAQVERAGDLIGARDQADPFAPEAFARPLRQVPLDEGLAIGRPERSQGPRRPSPPQQRLEGPSRGGRDDQADVRIERFGQPGWIGLVLEVVEAIQDEDEPTAPGRQVEGAGEGPLQPEPVRRYLGLKSQRLA